jgi:hypothetical protein
MNPAKPTQSRRPSLAPLLAFAWSITDELPPSDHKNSLRAVLHACRTIADEPRPFPSVAEVVESGLRSERAAAEAYGLPPGKEYPAL